MPIELAYHALIRLPGLLSTATGSNGITSGIGSSKIFSLALSFSNPLQLTLTPEEHAVRRHWPNALQLLPQPLYVNQTLSGVLCTWTFRADSRR